MRCDKCGTENPDRAKFCVECAAPFARRCPSCNAENPPTAKFCLECAKPLHAEATGAPSKTPSQRQAPDGERRHLTVLFSDLVNSTDIAAHLDPEDWRDIAAQYQKTAAAAVNRFGGNVAKYLGDGLMVYFGWPEAHEDDAERAVRAGLAIIDEVDQLNGRLASEHKVPLSVRVGIHTGPVVMGHGGGEEADVFGDVPNVASRVQSAAQPGSVLMTAAVHELVSGLFAVEDRGAHQLKGIEHPVQLYRAIQPSVVRRRTHRAAARALTPFVDREDEMRLLLNRWERTRTGQGQLVLVVGEPGIGKSRLVDEFRTRVRDNPHLWVECAGDLFSQSTPFHAVTEILNQGLGWQGDESPTERVTQLERNLELAGLKLSEAVPLIAEMLGLPIRDRYPPLVFAPDQQRRRLLANLTAWVLNAARVQPLVMVMEDLHWVDPSTLELAQTLVDQAATAPLMLLYTTRPEFRAPWPLRAHHAQITLNRLNDLDTREMVAGVVARAALAPDLIDTVVKRTDGVPLFAEELTRLILEGDSRSVAREIPATLRDSLTARLDLLGPAKEVAQIAAVIGREFSFELLQAVGSMGETQLQSALNKLVDAELIYARGIAPEATYQFKHALIQDAAYEALLKSRRRELHHRVAQTIGERFAAVAEAQPEVLARHWTEAGQAEPAIAAWKKAGESAGARRAFKEAEEAYRQALAMLNRLPVSPERDGRELELQSALLLLLTATGGYTALEAAETGARVRVLAESSGNISQLVLQMTMTGAGAMSAGDLSAFNVLADQKLDFARRDGNPTSLGLAHMDQVVARHWRGDLAGAEEYFALGRSYFDAPSFRQIPAAAGQTFGIASYNAWMLGLADTARKRVRQTTAAARENDSPYDLAFGQSLTAWLHIYLKESEEAESLASQSVALSEHHGFAQFAPYTRIVLGYARAQLGRANEGVTLMRQGLSRLAEMGARIHITSCLSWLAEAQGLDDATAGALATIEDALQANPDEIVLRPEAFRVRGELKLKLGETQRAEADFREAIALAQKMSAKAWELRATSSLARLLRDTNRRDEARTVLAEIYNWFTEGFDTADLKDAKALLEELSGSPR